MVRSRHQARTRTESTLRFKSAAENVPPQTQHLLGDELEASTLSLLLTYAQAAERQFVFRAPRAYGKSARSLAQDTRLLNKTGPSSITGTVDAEGHIVTWAL